MLVPILKKTDHSRIELFVFSFTILLYLFRVAIPVLKYPFFLAYSSIIIYSIFRYKERIISSLNEFKRNYYLLVILLILLTVSFLLSDKIFLTIFKDILNAIILLSFLLLMNMLIVYKNELKVFEQYLSFLIIGFAIIITVNEFGKLLNIFAAYSDYSVISQDNTAKSYLEIDNNFAILPVIFGMISILFLQKKIVTFSIQLILNFLLALFALAIIFSGSRRGLIALSCLVLTFFLIQIIGFLSNNKKYRSIGIGAISFFFSGILVIGLLTFYTSYTFKNRTLNMLGSKNLMLTKSNISDILFKYTSTINKKITYLDFYNKMWNVVPDNPDSGWGTRKYKTIYPLTGKRNEIVPSGSIGYLIDSTSNASAANGNSYSYTQIGSKNVKSDDSTSMSVYCYVSEDFNGEWVRLSYERTSSDFGEKYYDLNEKGTWQKLELTTCCTSGNIAAFLYLSKYGVDDFSKLTGYVIFAYPQVIVSRGGKNLRAHNWNKSINAQSKNVSTDFMVPTLDIKVNQRSNSDQIFNFAGIGDYLRFNEKGTLFFLLSIHNVYEDKDPLRNLVSKFINEDTTYFGYKKQLLVDAIQNNFRDERTVRWKFAIKIFSKEYSWKKKIFGGGFTFLNWYGFYFLKDKTASDWPHNPFLSILLYSGILGLLLYCFFLYKVFYYYIKYIKEYPLPFIFFLITFFFAFFSSGSPFDPPIFGFFSILPFFIHYVHKRDKESLEKANSINKKT